MKMNKADAKFLTGLLGKKCGFAMGARPVGAVDEKQMVIHDVAVCIQGEALGHGVWLDEEFIRSCIAQGNDAELLCHFGHEDSNAGRIKNYMGVFSNWVEKDAVGHDGEQGIGAYADIKFSKVAAKQGDNVDWVMGLARERPDALGLSIVFSVADYKVKTAEGELVWSEYIAGLEDEIKTWDDWEEAVSGFFDKSVDGKLYVVMGKLYGADFVAEGAATDGLFARGDADADDDPAVALREKFAKFAAVDAADAPAEPAADVPVEGSAEGEATQDTGDGSSPIESAPEPAQAACGELAEGTNASSAQPETQAESTSEQPVEAQPEASAEISEPSSQGANDTISGGEMKAELEALKKACDKRIAGFQSMHDKKIAEFNCQVEKLTAELAAAKDAASAAANELEMRKRELEAVAKERDELRERLTSVESAHRKLTAGALQLGEPKKSAATIAEFVKDHGGSFSRAVCEDPETYARICAANGWQPVALHQKH